MTTSTSSHIPTGEWQARAAVETFALGRQVGAQLSGGEVLLLDGPLGAGKTVFVKGLAAALGIDPDDVTSPSFTLVNPYVARLPLFHLDLYRLDEGAAAAHAVDLEELLTDEHAVVVIEWAERLGNYPLNATVWRVTIAGDGEATRTIVISAGNPAAAGDTLELLTS
ncbi:MAG TPA: tRNA (adenosine(37)-N6)-threonylcarbamoyltransferase complex ATPase subunit type 1 TsaE, partial [Pyrinomonadaceae bacterium]|nr:tRNA (adenosine(37)-N6)-threonylcarbamoyltransferase complex ATPase subunit type 1 TsaE [Pyrinomonadaceae bacterium]